MKLREPFCAVSHMIGAAFAVLGLAALIVASHGIPRHIFSVTVYGVSLIALYSSSTIYHSFHVSPKHEKSLQRVDHISIFLLIAGSYTPICMITLSRGWGMSLLAAIWTMATAGILTILFWRNHPHWIRVTLYVLMGWLAAAALPALYSALGISGMVWMVAGGLAYTFGIYFYANGDQSHRVWPGVLTGHDIWHLFVLTGSICHYILIFAYVAR